MEKMEKFEGVEPEIKKEINEEGFEDNAAVLIGKKEEMPKLLEKLEKEGRAENLGSYVKMHKEIALPKEEISEELAKQLKPGFSYLYTFAYPMKDDNVVYDMLYFVDKEGNIAKTKIIPEKIASLHGLPERKKDDKDKPDIIKAIEDAAYEAEEKELDNLGFDVVSGNESLAREKMESALDVLIRRIQDEIYNYSIKIERQIEEQIRQKKREEFDF